MENTDLAWKGTASELLKELENHTQILHQYIITDSHRTQNMRKRAWKNIDENSEHHSPLRPTNTLHVTRADAQSLPET
jgi:hypothetical protein